MLLIGQEERPTSESSVRLTPTPLSEHAEEEPRAFKTRPPGRSRRPALRCQQIARWTAYVISCVAFSLRPGTG
jgi:hypothetical protein